jgi:hypothetical protein
MHSPEIDDEPFFSGLIAEIKLSGCFIRPGRDRVGDPRDNPFPQIIDGNVKAKFILLHQCTGDCGFSRAGSAGNDEYVGLFLHSFVVAFQINSV